MTPEDLSKEVDNMRALGERLDEINEKLKDAPKDEQRNSGIGEMRSIKVNEINAENFRDSSKYRDAFYRSMVSGKIAPADSEIMEYGKRAITDMNGLSVTAGAEYLVPNTTFNQIQNVIVQYGKLYSAVTKYGFTGEVTLPIGALSNTVNEADGTDTLSFTFTEVSINQMAVIATVSVKNLLLKNSITALESFLAMEIGKYIGLQLENYLLVGDIATSKFMGIIKAIKDAGDDETYEVMDHDTICDVQAAIEEPYGGNAVWIMKRATFFKSFKKMQTADGMPLVTIALIQGGPGASRYLIDGQPVIFSRLMPDTDSFIYGDLSQYIVNESQSVVIETSTEAGFAADKTVWRGKVYSGGRPMFTDKTFKYYKKV